MPTDYISMFSFYCTHCKDFVLRFVGIAIGMKANKMAPKADGKKANNIISVLIDVKF